MSSCVHAVLLLAALALPLAAAQPWSRCDIRRSGRTYSADSAYEDNLVSLMGGLRDNSSSPAHFAASATSADPDTVYGVVLCRGDVSFSNCYDCGTRALQDAGPACNRSRDMALCYNQC